MKYLLPLILVLTLLCGCGQAAPEETASPTTPPPPASEGMYEPGQYQGALRVYPLDIENVQGLRTLDDSLLLISGEDVTTLTLLTGSDLTITAAVTLDFALSSDDPSLRIHPDGTLSCFSPVTRETLVLDGSLQIIRRISVPGDLTGQPILSDDGKTLYYCTASDVRAWDLESGIRRRVKEMAFDSQSVTNVLMDGTVLQCRIQDGETEYALFFSSENGQLLYREKGYFPVLSRGDRYYAAVPAGAVTALVFGEGDAPVQTLIPADLFAEGFFLPQLNGLAAVSAPDDAQIQLEYYELDIGSRISALTLAGISFPSAIGNIGDSLYILTSGSSGGRSLLYCWDISPESALRVSDDACRIQTYYTADAPDTAGLSLCQSCAQQIGQKYGVSILIWKEAAAAEPWDYDFEAEHLVPVILQELEHLDKRLSQYPEGLLEQTAAHFSSLNFCLVRSLKSTAETGPDTATGVQFLSGSDAYVVIAPGKYAEQALYHELFHVMETHIFSASTAFDQWDTLNPAGFQYDYSYTANALRDSGVYLQSDSRAFVDTYSMSFPKEDRARIMEYAMLPDMAHLFRAPIMQKKLAALCAGIREAYGLKKSEETFLWEPYLE